MGTYSQNELNVVYCCSDLFAPVLGVSMASLFENNKEFEQINVYVFDENISENSRNKLIELSNKYSRKVIFIEVNNPTEYFKDERFTIKALGHSFGRLIVGDVLQDVGRILSLDCDTLVLGDLHELWCLDMEGNWMAGVDDCMGAETMEKILDVDPNSDHYNAGMYLMDLDEWRQNKLGDVFKKYIINVFDKGKTLAFYEEETIDNTISNHILTISPKYDFMTVDAVFSYDEVLKFRKPSHYYSREVMEEAKANPVIIHATTLFYIKKRIFEDGSKHPYKKEYDYYKTLTPWKDIPNTISQRSFKNNLIKSMWHWMPRWMSIRVASFVRNKIRPFLKHKRDDE